MTSPSPSPPPARTGRSSAGWSPSTAARVGQQEHGEAGRRPSGGSTMIEQEHVPAPWRVVRSTRRRTVGAPRPVPGAARVTGAVAAQQVARWADDFAGVLGSEIRDAQRRGVISDGEGEQLLARLVVVLDQAVSPSWAP